MEYITMIIFCMIGVLFYFMSQKNNNSIIAFLGGTMFLIVGVVGLVQGIQIPAGELQTYNTTMLEDNSTQTTTGTIQTETIYETMNPLFSRAVAMLLLLSGLYIMYMTWESKGD